MNAVTLHQVLEEREDELKLVYFYEKLDDHNMPTVKLLASRFRMEGLTVARISTVENELPDIAGLPVPFLALLRGVGEEYHIYEGDWSLEDILRFVHEYQ